MFDIVIIGAGTAGLSAAIYASRAGKSALVLEGKAYGGQIINTPDIENYPGIAHISGFDFATGLYDQAKALGAVIKMQQALRITKADGRFLVETRRETHEAKAVILATGAKNRPLGLEKEEALIGRGISYCATCDGMFYRGKTVAVNGGGNTAVEDAMFLTGYCEKVYLIHRRDAFRADEKEVERLREKENVEFVLDSVVEALEETDGRLSGIRLKNVKSGESSELPVGGLFIAIGQVPDNGAFQDLVDLDEKGYIIAGEDLKTKTEGVFTAGDCRTKEVRQLTTAASDGAVAALAASKYIDALT
ncbi:MAG: thioredoxin-disulfide reductase [Lachnospiraceae bacterium]|nr:thioredoxin-disulfide reductase [Lachnospiraceae bacterium]